jgi:hypothetical protein
VPSCPALAICDKSPPGPEGQVTSNVNKPPFPRSFKDHSRLPSAVCGVLAYWQEMVPHLPGSGLLGSLWPWYSRSHRSPAYERRSSVGESIKLSVEYGPLMKQFRCWLADCGFSSQLAEFGLTPLRHQQVPRSARLLRLLCSLDVRRRTYHLDSYR